MVSACIGLLLGSISITASPPTITIGESTTISGSITPPLEGENVAIWYRLIGEPWGILNATVPTNATGQYSYIWTVIKTGTYELKATWIGEEYAAESSKITVDVKATPTASFTYTPNTPTTGETVTFDASASSDPDGTIDSYAWDFGDTTTGTGETTTHAYTTAGTYTITLTVTDNDTLTDTEAKSITVIKPPVASFTYSPTAPLVGDTVTFDASASTPNGGTIVRYDWNFGDGASATGSITTHVYTTFGTYTVTLTVTDSEGLTDATSKSITIYAPPVSSFTYSPAVPTTGETVTFDASGSSDPDGTIASYAWDFDDGNTGTGVTAAHAYTTAGTYTITLTVTDDDGLTDNTTSDITVSFAPQSPVASFTYSPTTPTTGETVTFDGSASDDPDGTIASHAWNFGDGANGTSQIVTHIYADNGTYTVTLNVTDSDGLFNTTSIDITVLNRPPNATFTESAETVDTGETVTFNASDSYDPDGSIVTYFWDFGDGENDTGVVVEHAYTDNGTYTVTLTVTDDDGATDTATATKTVSNRSPVASFTESPETVYTNETIYFNASDSYDPDGSIVSYWWDFDDGKNATGVTTEHSYPLEGNYTVTLTVTDDDGATNSTSTSKKVLNRPPVAVFTESAETVYTNETIHFNASDSYDLDGTIESYFWDFGDGTNATGVVVEHTYEDDGTYTVTLTVTDDDDATGTATATKTVLNRPPVAIFTESAETVYTGEVITFDASDSHDPDGTIVTYHWDFGDGTNGEGEVVEHSYIDDGTYTVTLTVTDDGDATSSTTASKTVLDGSPIASFTESAETVYTGEVIYFNASASYDPNGVIVSYYWDFGDGTNATGVIVDHAYADDGVYTVTLTVTDNYGATDTASSSKTLLNRPPVASFSESAETVYTGETITFNASTSYDPDGSIVSYFWDFGDGTNAMGVTADHAYADDDVYIVTLTVTDDDGETASKSAVKTVSNRPPIASFTDNATMVDINGVIRFNASDSYDPDGSILSYFWDFGDGTNATMAVILDHAYTKDGNYTVTLTVTDDDGAPSSVSTTIIVKASWGWPLVLIAGIASGIAALTGTPIYVIYGRGKKSLNKATALKNKPT